MNKIKDDEAWAALCRLSSQLFPKYGGRRAAFEAACEQRPDLAEIAIDPQGNRLAPRFRQQVPTTQVEKPSIKPPSSAKFDAAVEARCEAAREEVRQRAAQVARICQDLGFGDRTPDFIESGKSASEV